MKKCKNCEKEIADSMNFCNEECLRAYQEKRKQLFSKACPESVRILESDDSPTEIKEIMDCLGRGGSEGMVHGTHLSKILSVCRNPPIGVKNYRDLISYLALVCGMHKRYVTESYLDGLEVCGVLVTVMINNDKFFKWVGLQAFNNKEKEKEKK